MQEKECNRQFLIAALTRQLFNCCDKHHYQAGVLVSNSEKTKLLDIIIQKIISENFGKHVKFIVSNRCDYQIRFDNDSIFKILLGAESSRGHRYNDLLIDSDLNHESRFNYGKSKVLPYRPDDKEFENYDVKREWEEVETRIVTLNIG
jgi:hypothetical protein